MEDEFDAAVGPCDGLVDPFSRFVCETVGDGGIDPGGWLQDQTLGRLARAMAEGAETLVVSMWSLIMETTAVDLTADWVKRNVYSVMLIALPIVVALYIVQLATAAWRRQPSELVRAVVGMVGGFATAAVALSVTHSVLMLTDWASDLIMRWRVGVEVGEAIDALTPVMLVAAAQGHGVTLPVILIIVFAFLYILASVMVWFALMARKALIIVAAVFAPLAFAGLTSRWSSAWPQRWLSIMFALAISKITVVMTFAIAASAIRGGISGTAGSTLRVIGELSMGLMLLAVAAIAPWLSYRFLDFLTPAGRDWDGSLARGVVAGHTAAHSARTLMIRTRSMAVASGASAALSGVRLATTPVKAIQRQRQADQ